MASQVSGRFVERNVVDPKGIVQVYRGYYWWCIEGDPERALFYLSHYSKFGSPQCNANESVARSVGQNLGYPESAKLVMIPLAFVPWET